MNHKRIAEIIIVTLLFALLGIVYTFPLVSYFRKAMPYTHYPPEGYEVRPLVQGDYLQLYYKLWLFKDAFHGKTPFLSDPYQFSVEDGRGRFSTQFLPLSLVFLLFSPGGDIFAYNALVILSFALAGLGTYLLVKFYTHSGIAALIGGTIFSLAPYRLAQLLGGHPNGFIFCLIPLAVYFFEQAFSKQSIKYGIFSGLCILSMALMELHLVYYLCLLLVPFMLIRAILFVSIEKTGGWDRGVIPIIIFMFLSVCCIFAIRHMGTSIVEGGRRISEVKLFSPSPGDILRRVNPESERSIYLGIIPCALGAWGFATCFSSRARRNTMKLVTAIFYFLVVALSYVLCLGPNLQHVFPLYQFLYRHLPYFNYPRVPGRIIVLTFLGLSVLAGVAVVKIQTWGGKRKWLGAIVAAVCSWVY